MKEFSVTNLNKLYVLLSLRRDPKHGYVLMRDFSEKLGQTVRPAQVYPFPRTLQRKGYVKVVERGERDRKTYSLTEEGKHFLERILKRFSDLLDIAIEPRLTSCAHCGCSLYKGGHLEEIQGKQLVFCCVHCARSYKREISGPLWWRIIRHPHQNQKTSVNA
ncbi:MAG: helix-turn-helix transcriptional regulator [Candidatus Geothermarchaeales archaeon]